ncbi:AraC family transcriptional regulator [Streptomyces minutiscleroticus]|uniref:HTH araC/xylS-type domain-containing protein n=1 Tax=Streptomyces minutiscleroticus TaxID=68238 RepID=A0A918NPF1_9ACTN|nr:AraC family transcriptional regulator [Streptomyces minutiscleroticus]GGX84412.1 hypothetical protein GCM10010358_43260 [Streptomyces minutiscleroticus]
MFATTDAETAWAFLDATYGARLGINTTVATTDFRHARSDGGTFSVDDYQVPADWRFDSDPLNALVLVQATRGRIEVGCGDDHQYLAPGDVVVRTHGPDLPCSGRAHDTELRIVTLSERSFVEATGGVYDELDGPLRLPSREPRSRALAQAWKRTVTYLTDDVLANPEARAEPLVMSNAERMLAAATAAAFPRTAAPGEPSDRSDATPPLLRRAVAYIESHPDADIGVADIAAAVHVSPRALQYAFRRHLDTTPVAYLRQVRLDHAHQDLRRADPSDGDTVASIALRWGFLHQGRFARLYRDAYGTSPGHTLRQ